MADLGQDFNPDGHEHVSFGPIPNGEYEMMIVSSDVKQTKKGDGSYATFDMVVIGEGEYQNRHVFQNITVENPSDKATEMGRRQLADLCRACGKGAIRDTAELHDVPFWAKVGIEKPQEGYQPKNRILEFIPPQASAPVSNAAPTPARTTAPARTAPAPAARASTAPARKPWERKAS